VPSASPVASAQDLVQTLLGVASSIVLPDWRALVALFPIFLGLLFLAWSLLTVRRFATVGPRRRAPARIQPITPPEVHMPGGSTAPILVAIGAGALFLGLVFGGLALTIGVVVLIVTMLAWFREAVRDYDHLEPASRLPAVVHQGPPPGVHMPGPSIRPLLAALGSGALLGGLVIGGWVLILAVVFLTWTLLGWLTDAKAEYHKVEESDDTGHLENIPARRFPARPLQVFAVLFVLLGMWQLGVFPPAAPATAGDGTGAPAASGGGGGGAPPGSIPLTAMAIAFEQKELTAPANQPFTIYLTNNDTPSTPHDVEIRGPDDKPIKTVPPTPGGESQAYDYDALEPGEYTFICSIHPIPAMTGTLKVQ
jgi:plastocyanin